MILAFKHADRLHSAPAFAGWMLRAAGDLPQLADVIVPVPLHRWRLFSRRYNQAAVLAAEIGRLAGCPVAPDALVRTRATPSQGHLGPRDRRQNVAGAFAVGRGRRERIKGRRVLLVDDVMTTGATVDACAEALMVAGADHVDVVTLARAVARHDSV